MATVEHVRCACGCGRTRPSRDRNGRPRQYLPGHNPSHQSINGQVQVAWERARPIRDMLLAGGRLPGTRQRTLVPYGEADNATDAEVERDWRRAAPTRAHLLAGGTLATAPPWLPREAA